MKKFIVFFMLLTTTYICAEDIIIQVKTDSENFSSRTLRAGEISFSIRPLIKNNRSGFMKNWFIARTNERFSGSPWDLAHQIARENREVVYAEPDRPVMNENYRKLAEALTLENEARGYDESWGYPDPDVFAWHLEDSHSQLKRARKEAPHKGPLRVRVAHFDTGYTPAQITCPENIRTDLQKNFVEGENENSAVDPGVEGFLFQPGHGTSTLSVLAGNLFDLPDKKFKDYLGGAPEVDIVPMRLSSTVLLFQVSVFAQALNHAVDTECNVVSMSMGGVASKLWAEAVNEAYNNGITIVTAAGNNVLRLPTHYLVYPAKFRRVIAVCGVGYDHNPYFKEDPWFLKMQGNWGPENLMDSAIAAYTPNTPSGKMKNPTHIGIGGGTSAATPQIAAAVAIWLQKYQGFTYKHPWQRVNAVRNALFSSARKDLPNSKKYYGNGTIRAADALKVAPTLDNKKIPKDKVFLPYLSILFGWNMRNVDNVDPVKQEMIEVELAQLEQGNPELRALLEKIDIAKAITPQEKQQIREALSKIPEASKTIVEALK